ncbi:MAG: TetR/AcrR family transcriptional regulator [Burkholderiaceae bacterium]
MGQLSSIASSQSRASSARKPTRERLLGAGVRLARHSGLRKLTVRGVCTAAHANLGTFVYHFGSREAFVAQLIEHWYAPLLERLEATVDQDLPPRERLRALALQLAGWAVNNGRLMTHVVMDAAAGEAAAQTFLRSLAGRHPALILRVIVEGQKAGAFRRDEPLHMMLFLMSSIALPILLADRMQQSGLAPAELARAIKSFASTPEHIERRLDWALRGLSLEDCGNA